MFNSLSIVIATLPSNYESWWVEQINSYSNAGISVFISLPSGYSKNDLPKGLDHNMINILISPGVGQVHQRCFAFKSTKTEFVLQMDDDVKLTLTGISSLLKTAKSLGDKIAVAPCKYIYPSGQAYTSTPNINTLASIKAKLEAHLIHGIPWNLEIYGRITPNGFGYRYPLNISSKHPLPAEWLPGGCILQYRKNLLLDFNYPFEGKAYLEDFFCSYLLKEKKISLYYDPNVEVGVIPPSLSEYKPNNILRYPPDYKARLYYVQMVKGSLFRLHLYYNLNIIANLLLFVPIKVLNVFSRVKKKISLFI